MSNDKETSSQDSDFDYKAITELETLTYELTNNIIDKNLSVKEIVKKHKEWIGKIVKRNEHELIYLTSILTSSKTKPDAIIKALREGIISEIERKNTDYLANTLVKFEDSVANYTNVLQKTLLQFENSVERYTDKLIDTMEQLNNSANKLSRRSYVVATIAALFAILQVILAFLQFYYPK